MMTENFARPFANMRELDDEPAGTAADIPWLPSWLPIAHDLGGSYLFLDLREGPQHGCVGRSNKEDISFSGPVWPSVTVMLAETAGALVNGTDVGGWFPGVEEDGRFGWQHGRWRERADR